MGSFFVHLAETAAWFLAVVMVFAVIGVVAVIKWIVDATHRTEAAVHSGIENVEGHFHHHDQP